MIRSKYFFGSFLFLTITFLSFRTSAQDAIYSNAIDLYQKMPAAPNSASLGKYFEYPVNMSTGIPSIQIPLFQISSGNINLPVTLTYHAGGVRINENPSWVGMGWSLNAGGIINKRVNGLDDFTATTGVAGSYTSPAYGSYSPDFNDISTSVDSSRSSSYMYSICNPPYDCDGLYRFWGKIAQGCIDGEADEFIYSTPGGGGKFFYNQKLATFQTDKINAWNIGGEAGGYIGSVLQIGTWHLTAPNGINYKFGLKEETKSPAPNITSSVGFCLAESPASDLTNAWYLTEIQDQVHDKSISLHYNKVQKKSEAGMNIAKKYYTASGGTNAGDERSANTRRGDEVSLSHIYFDQGSLVFIQESQGRLDGGINALKEIKLLDKESRHIKSYLFKYFYTLADTVGYNTLAKNPMNYIYAATSLAIKDTFSRRLFLESVQEVTYNANGDTIKNPPYKFTYDFTHNLPTRYSYALDSWGYYNGKDANTSLLPDDVLQMFNTFDRGTGANRSIDTNYTRTGTIKELQYPTGGKTIFQFENNKLGVHLLGGLRVKRIINYDSLTSKSLTTEYEYLNGIGQYYPQHYYSYVEKEASGPLLHSITKVSGNTVYPLFSGLGSPIVYTEVNRTQVGEGVKLRSKHFFKYENGSSFEGSYQEEGVPHPKQISYDNFSGIEYRTELYKETTPNNFVLIQRDSSEYTALNNYNNFFWNIQTAWVPRGTGGWVIWPYNDPWTVYPMNTIPGTHIYKQLQDQDVVRYKRSFVRDDNGNDIVKESWFDYDTRNGNQWLVKTLNENQDTLITQIKYAPQYDYATEVSVSPVAPVEIISLLKKPGTSDSLLLAAILYNYEGMRLKKVYRIDLPTPIAISSFQRSYNTAGTFYRDSRYKLFQEVVQWSDNAKPLTVEARSGNQAYIWDQEESQVGAFAQNAVNNDIAYTSFETNHTGNWTISGGSVNNSKSITGTKGYNLAGSISKTGLTSQDYMITYWSRSGSMLVNSASGTAGEQKDGWTFYKHTVTSATSVTLSGTGIIDELRLHPKAAHMTSYTYHPLIGISSISDATGRISYYEYDDFKRLSLIRDQDNNILKKYCYKYTGEPDACEPIVYYNDEQSGGYTRDNCSVGYVGTYVLYTVPANTYSSIISKADANQQALNDVAANRAAHANTNGTCIPSIYAYISYENYEYAGSLNTVYADIVVRFYQDEAMTIPVSVTDLTINFVERIIGNSGGSSINQTNPFSRTITGYEYTVEARYPVEVDDLLAIQIYSNIYVEPGTGYQIAL